MMYYHKTFITLIKIQIVANEFINPYQMQSPRYSIKIVLKRFAIFTVNADLGPQLY